jgi:hypothetical protein
MKETLGATDADLARREDIRYDRFGVRGLSNTPAVRSEWSKERHLRPVGRNSKDPESESEASSDMDDDGDGDDDDEEEILPRVGDASSTMAEGKAVAASASKGESATGSNQLGYKRVRRVFEVPGDEKEESKVLEVLIFSLPICLRGGLDSSKSLPEQISKKKKNIVHPSNVCSTF